MRHHRLALATAAAIAVAPFTPIPAFASPVPAHAVAPADVATPTVVKHVLTDKMAVEQGVSGVKVLMRFGDRLIKKGANGWWVNSIADTYMER